VLLFTHIEPISFFSCDLDFKPELKSLLVDSTVLELYPQTVEYPKIWKLIGLDVSKN